MKPRTADSLDTVEMVMAIEEVFDVDLPDAEASTFDGPSDFVDWLEVSLANQLPNKAACALLKKLAHEQQGPELAEGLDGP